MTTTKRSNFSAALRTTLLMAGLGGPARRDRCPGRRAQGRRWSSWSSRSLFNLGAYWFSDRIALAAARAKPVSEEEDPRLYQMVRDLTTRAGLPMPRLYVIPQEQPNAFATGRNPKHSAVAVTAGIRKLLSEDELRGVLAHELGHVRNRDILLCRSPRRSAGRSPGSRYMLLWFGGDDDSPLGRGRRAGDGAARATRRGDHPDGDLAPAGVLRRRDRRRDLRQSGVARLGPAATRVGRPGDADAGQQGDRAALHRQAVQAVAAWPRSSRPIRRSRSGSAACGRCAPPSVSADGVSGAEFRNAFWRPSNQMKVENTDLAKQLEAETLGARLWRLHPGQARPSTGIVPSTSSTSCSREPAGSGWTTSC